MTVTLVYLSTKLVCINLLTLSSQASRMKLKFACHFTLSPWWLINLLIQQVDPAEKTTRSAFFLLPSSLLQLETGAVTSLDDLDLEQAPGLFLCCVEGMVGHLSIVMGEEVWQQFYYFCPKHDIASIIIRNCDGKRRLLFSKVLVNSNSNGGYSYNKSFSSNCNFTYIHPNAIKFRLL